MKKITAFAAFLAMLLCLSVITVSASGTTPFLDLNESAWYMEGIEYCYNNEYVKGMTATAFEPEGTVTRAQVATILANMAGYDAEFYKNSESFVDVSAEQWFSPAVEWAYLNGVANGVGGGRFDPDSPVTREQLAMFLCNYLGYVGMYSSPEGGAIDGFDDVSSVSVWAKDAMNWAVENGIMGGYNNNLTPGDTATRAQLAKMIMMFDKSFDMKTEEITLASYVTLSNAFSDDMILQRDEKCSVWGWADKSDEGTYVKVSIGDKTAYGKVTDGEWKAEFYKTFPASTEGTKITVEGADGAIEINNVLFGDVYYVIGQSNVHYSIYDLTNDLAYKGLLDELKVDYEDSRNIRFFRNSSVYTVNNRGTMAQGTDTVYEDVVYNTNWQTPSDVLADINYVKSGAISQAPSCYVFSALGYLFAYDMSEITNVPIGVIEIDASGYPLITFAPNELAEKWGDEGYNSATGTYYYNLKDGYNGNVNMATRFGYNHLIHPLKNFSVAGLIWYQGESDCVNTIELWGEDGDTFADQFTELMTYFRNDFGNSDFPVYMIEFPTVFYNGGMNAFLDTGGVRCDQGVISKQLEDFYLVTCSDMFNDKTWGNSIHPYIKHKQASRLVGMVAANQYGIGDLEYVSGPLFDSVEYDENTAVVSFKNVGDGLKTVGSHMVKGIEVYVESNGSYVWQICEDTEVSATNTVTVSAETTIYGVRYNRSSEAYFYTGGVNLCNSEIIPAAAFIDIK